MNTKKILKQLAISFGVGVVFLFLMWLFVISFTPDVGAGMSGGGSSSSSAPEGTAVLSTGEAGGTKFLREDGDGTSSWQAQAVGAGDLLADGTVPLTANWDVGNFSITMRDLIAVYGVAGATMSISGLATVGTIQTGQGATEVYLMNQAVQTTDAVTFDKITSTTDITASSMSLTGSGQSSLNAGIILNADSGSTSASNVQIKTNTEDYMVNTDANDDSMSLGGGANSWKIAKGGIITPSGTCSIALPNAASPTTNAAGETAIDTTTGAGSGILYYTDAEYFEPAWKSKSFVIVSPSADSDYSIWRIPYAISIKAIHVLTTGGTNVIGGLDEADANGANAVAIDADITATAGTNANDDGSLTNAAVDATDYINWHTTSVSGIPTNAIVTFDYIVTP